MSFIGIVCGLRSEAAAVAASVDRSKIRVGISGANAQRAEAIAHRFCEKGANAILSIGVSGGLDPALQPGDVVIGDRVIADDGSRYESDGFLLASFKDKHPRVTLFGSDEIIDSTVKKSALFHNHGAAAVDMESHGAARAAARAGAPFAAIRAIADPADRALPAAALNAVAPDGSTRIISTLASAMRDPQQFPELMKLGQDSAAATRALRRDLGLLFRSLFLSFDL